MVREVVLSIAKGEINCSLLHIKLGTPVCGLRV